MTDMLQLRLMLVGGYAGLVTFHSLHAKPLLIPLRWSALFVVVNAGAAMMLFIDQWIGALLTDEEMDLYEQNFKTGLTPGQFYHLLKMAKTTEIADGSVLTKEGQYSPNLYFIEKGQAKVYHRGTFASHVDQGGFVNDVAFQRTQTVHGDNHLPSENDNNNSNEQVQPRGVGAYGTVVANGDCKVWVWDQAELKEFLKNRPDMDRNMKYTLSQHLVRSLLKQREVRRLASTEEQEVLEKTELTMPERRDFRRVKTSSWP
jgi:CRP-like cAMP-binding protein